MDLGQRPSLRITLTCRDPQAIPVFDVRGSTSVATFQKLTCPQERANPRGFQGHRPLKSADFGFESSKLNEKHMKIIDF